MSSREPMPPKLEDEVKRVAVITPRSLLSRIEDWRRAQPDPIPNLSEAYRRLIEKGLDAEAKGKKKAPKS